MTGRTLLRMSEWAHSSRTALQRSFSSSPSAHAVLQTIRWLTFLTASLVIAFGYRVTSIYDALPSLMVVALYSVGNAIAGRHLLELSQNRNWRAKLFLADLSVITVAVLTALGADTQFYLVCSLILYFSVLAKDARTALPVAVLGTLLYSVILSWHTPAVNLLHTAVLIRLPFFFLLALFTGYLSEQEEANRQRVAEMAAVETLLRTRVQEITRELEHKQAQLLQSEKMASMGHLASVVAHELKNVLLAVLGYVDIGLQDIGPDHQACGALKGAQHATLRGNALLHDLLIFARARRSAVQPIAVKAAVREALDLVKAAATGSHVNVVSDLQDVPMLAIAKGDIEQIVVNLANNAIDAMNGAGTLTVRLYSEQPKDLRWVVLEVHDTGSGIADDVRDRIFQPFFTTKESGKGTGLGLSIVQDIVTSHRGSVRLDTGINRGTTVTVRFPEASPADRARVQAAGAEQPHAGVLRAA